MSSELSNALNEHITRSRAWSTYPSHQPKATPPTRPQHHAQLQVYVPHRSELDLALAEPLPPRIRNSPPLALLQQEFRYPDLNSPPYTYPQQSLNEPELESGVVSEHRTQYEVEYVHIGEQSTLVHVPSPVIQNPKPPSGAPAPIPLPSRPLLQDVPPSVRSPTPVEILSQVSHNGYRPKPQSQASQFEAILRLLAAQREETKAENARRLMWEKEREAKYVERQVQLEKQVLEIQEELAALKATIGATDTQVDAQVHTQDSIVIQQAHSQGMVLTVGNVEMLAVSGGIDGHGPPGRGEDGHGSSLRIPTPVAHISPSTTYDYDAPISPVSQPQASHTHSQTHVHTAAHLEPPHNYLDASQGRETPMFIEGSSSRPMVSNSSSPNHSISGTTTAPAHLMTIPSPYVSHPDAPSPLIVLPQQVHLRGQTVNAYIQQRGPDDGIEQLEPMHDFDKDTPTGGQEINRTLSPVAPVPITTPGSFYVPLRAPIPTPTAATILVPVLDPATVTFVLTPASLAPPSVPQSDQTMPVPTPPPSTACTSPPPAQVLGKRSAPTTATFTSGRKRRATRPSQAQEQARSIRPGSSASTNTDLGAETMYLFSVESDGEGSGTGSEETGSDQEQAESPGGKLKRRNGHDDRCLTIQHALRVHIHRTMRILPSAPLPDSHPEGTPLPRSHPVRFNWSKTCRGSPHNAAMKQRILSDMLAKRKKLYRHVPEKEFTDRAKLEAGFDQAFTTMRQKFKMQTDETIMEKERKREEGKAVRARRAARKKAKLGTRLEMKKRLPVFSHSTFEPALQLECLSSEESCGEDEQPTVPGDGPNSRVQVLRIRGLPWRSSRLLRFFTSLDSLSTSSSSVTSPSSDAPIPTPFTQFPSVKKPSKRPPPRKERCLGPPKDGLVLPPKGIKWWMVSRRWLREVKEKWPEVDLEEVLGRLVTDGPYKLSDQQTGPDRRAAIEGEENAAVLGKEGRTSTHKELDKDIQRTELEFDWDGFDALGGETEVEDEEEEEAWLPRSGKSYELAHALAEGIS